MSERMRLLPPGWYPEDPEQVRGYLSAARTGGPAGAPIVPEATAAVAPHAGWAFSGALAARSVASLGPCDTVAVVGGHLPASAAPLAASEDSFETPLGPLEADRELLAALRGELELRPDRAADNTVEVQLPLVAAAKPGVRILWLRAPNGRGALALGEALARAAAATGRRLTVLGSTDLTHYGPNYGFMPAGRGPAAERWVREVNDARFIEALLACDPEAVLARGEEEGSACSSGAAATAISFVLATARADAAKREGKGGPIARLLGYATSLDLRRDDSFVGYAAVAYAF